MCIKSRHTALLPLFVVPVFACASTVTFSSHTQTCSGCGDNFFYHADLKNDGYEDLVYISRLMELSRSRSLTEMEPIPLP